MGGKNPGSEAKTDHGNSGDGIAGKRDEDLQIPTLRAGFLLTAAG